MGKGGLLELSCVRPRGFVYIFPLFTFQVTRPQRLIEQKSTSSFLTEASETATVVTQASSTAAVSFSDQPKVNKGHVAGNGSGLNMEQGVSMTAAGVASVAQAAVTAAKNQAANKPKMGNT